MEKKDTAHRYSLDSKQDFCYIFFLLYYNQWLSASANLSKCIKLKERDATDLVQDTWMFIWI